MNRVDELSCIGFFLNLSTQMFNPVISIYMYGSLKFSVMDIGIAVSLFFVASAIAKIIAGLFVFQKWLKLSISIGSFIVTLIPLAYRFAFSYSMIAAIRLIHGFGNALFWTTALTFSILVAPSNRIPSTIARYATVVAVGLMLGPLIGALTISLFGIRSTFFISTFVAIPSVVLSLDLVRKVHTDELKTKKPTYFDLKTTLLNRRIIAVVVAFFSFHYAFSALSTYAPIQARNMFSVSDSTVALLFFGYTAVTLLSRIALSKHKQTHTRMNKLVLLLVLLSSSIALLVTSLSPFLWFFAMGFILIGVSKGLIFPITSASVAEVSPIQSMMLANAIYLLPVDFGALVSPVAASFLASNYGIPSALWASSLVPLFGLGLILIATRNSVSPEKSASKTKQF